MFHLFTSNKSLVVSYINGIVVLACVDTQHFLLLEGSGAHCIRIVTSSVSRFSTCSKCMQLLFDALALLLKIVLSLFGILSAILKLSIQCLSDARYILLLGTPEVLER